MRNLNYLHVYIIAVQSVIIPCERITTEGIDTFVTTCQQMASTFDHYYPHGGLDIILLFHIAFYFVYGVSEDGEIYLLWLLGSVEFILFYGDLLASVDVESWLRGLAIELASVEGVEILHSQFSTLN